MAEINQSGVAVSRFREAFDRLLPEIDALPESELVTINVDVPQAVTSALGSWKEIASLREKVAKELPAFDIARFDKVEAYALATGHAHALFMAASTPAGMQELVEEAARMRELLHSDAVALSKRGLIDGQRLKELKGPQGHRNLAFDLLALTAMVREKWTELQGKTALQAQELDAAEALADRVISGVGAREQAPGIVVAATDTRQRAFSLFVKAYDQARRAISFLRWDHGDVDTIAPSLYAGRGGRRRGSDSSVVATGTPTTQTPAQPPVTPSSTSAGTQQAPVGLPGGSPFTQS